jgi:hypothetical protein
MVTALLWGVAFFNGALDNDLKASKIKNYQYLIEAPLIYSWIIDPLIQNRVA